MARLHNRKCWPRLALNDHIFAIEIDLLEIGPGCDQNGVSVDCSIDPVLYGRLLLGHVDGFTLASGNGYRREQHEKHKGLSHRNFLHAKALFFALLGTESIAKNSSGARGSTTFN